LSNIFLFLLTKISFFFFDMSIICKGLRPFSLNHEKFVLIFTQDIELGLKDDYENS